MVRAGVIDHPIKWVNSGYHEIQQPPKRYRVIDLAGLLGLCGFSKLADFQQAHRQRVDVALRRELSLRDARWSEAVAVGNLAFVEKVKSELGIKALHREFDQVDGTYALRESSEAYRGQFDIKNDALRLENTLPWERIS